MSYHTDLERALNSIEESVQDARNELSCLPDTSEDLESDLGTACDELRGLWDALGQLAMTDLEDVVDAVLSIQSDLDNIITTLQDHYNRL